MESTHFPPSWECLTHLASDQLLGHLNGGFTECSTILGTDFCANVEEWWVITVGL